MAGFRRTTLKEKGLTDEQIDYIMGEANRFLAADYVPKADVQVQIDEAVKKVKPAEVNVLETEEYKSLAAQLAMTKALNSEDFANVKPKFREAVYKMLDTGDKAKPVSEQLTGIAENYEEYFNKQQEQEPKKPQFGEQTQGSMPTGNEKPSFGNYWGFVPKSKG